MVAERKSHSSTVEQHGSYYIRRECCKEHIGQLIMQTTTTKVGVWAGRQTNNSKLIPVNQITMAQ